MNKEKLVEAIALFQEAMTEDKDKAPVQAKAAYLLSGAFVWADTKEGHKYWSRIHNRLQEIAKGVLK